MKPTVFLNEQTHKHTHTHTFDSVYILCGIVLAKYVSVLTKHHAMEMYPVR